MILDATGRLNITRFGRVTDALTEGLIEMEKTQEVNIKSVEMTFDM